MIRKKIIITSLIALGGLFLTAQAQDDTPNFEFWNKTNQPVYFYFGGSYDQPIDYANVDYAKTKAIEKQADLLGRVPQMAEVLPNHYTDPFISAKLRAESGKNLLAIAVGGLPDQNTLIHIYRFKQSAYGKTLYVRVKEGKTTGSIEFGPQTGPFLGLSGKTERGYPLKNNVKQSDIEYLGTGKYPQKVTTKLKKDPFISTSLAK